MECSPPLLAGNSRSSEAVISNDPTDNQDKEEEKREELKEQDEAPPSPSISSLKG